MNEFQEEIINREIRKLWDMKLKNIEFYKNLPNKEE